MDGGKESKNRSARSTCSKIFKSEIQINEEKTVDTLCIAIIFKCFSIHHERIAKVSGGIFLHKYLFGGE